jgi:tetratricopeptide (TPR) repeat protein
MKTVIFFLLLLEAPFICSAQFDGDKLVDIASMLSINRHTNDVFVWLNSRRFMAQPGMRRSAAFRQRTASGAIPTHQDTAQIDARTSRELSFHYIQQQDFEKGVALLEKSTELDPKQHREAAWTYMMTFRDYPRALRHLEAFDALTPDLDDSDGISPISYHKGLCDRGMGNHAEAIRQFSKGIDSLAKKHGSEWVNYKHYVTRAISYLVLNQPDKALADLEAAQKNSTSESPLALYYTGKAYGQQGRTTDARRAFQDALFFWQANRVKGITQPEDYTNPVTEQDIEEALKQ